ncbi:MAG: ABC transporter permease [Gemmatimonadales bacterium]
MIRDLRYSIRSLRRSPGFALAAVATLAIGIGANTAVFSLVNGVLLNPLPFESPERLVMVWGRHTTIGRETASLPDYLDWKRQSKSFADMAALANTRYNLSTEGEPAVVRGTRTTANLFPVLGMAPSVGRVFTADDERAGAARVTILSHGFWQRQFGSDRGVVGRTILLSGVPHAVVGVAPAAFRLQQDVDVWTPLVTDSTRPRRADFLTVVGRLRSGIPISEAQGELSTIARRLEAEYPQSNTGWGVELVALQEQLVGESRPALLVFMGAVALVMLIACANVANLMLARVTAREREITLRAALGASRRRIVREILTESVVLSLLSGVVGVVVAASAIGALRSLAPLAIPRLHEIGLNLPVLGFTFALSLFTGIVFGLAPAVRALGRDLQSGLKEGGRGAAGGVGIRSTRGILVLAEVALAFMLLIGATLLLRSFDRLQRVDPGFKSDGVFTATVALPRAQYAEPAAQTAFADLLLERIQAVPGVRAAALSSDPPLGGSPPFWSFIIAGVEPPPPGVVQDAVVFMTSPEYFQTAEIPLVAGAVYGAEHRADGSPVAVVSQALAQRYWSGRSAVGQRITLGDPADSAGWMTVIGVVGDVRNEELGRPTYPQLYLPIAQAPVPSMVVLARTAGDPLELAGTVKRALTELDADLPLSEVATLDQRVADTLARPRVNAALLTAFAAVALLLAAVGIYGVIAFGVVQRTRELGIRMALGAGTDRLLRLVVHQGMRPVLAGIVLGLVGALLGTRLLRGLLFGVGATDPVTFLAVTAFLLVVAFGASYLPARRAARSDPMIALRNE